jgi:hypothetical protein
MPGSSKVTGESVPASSAMHSALRIMPLHSNREMEAFARVRTLLLCGVFRESMRHTPTKACRARTKDVNIKKFITRIMIYELEFVNSNSLKI